MVIYVDARTSVVYLVAEGVEMGNVKGNIQEKQKQKWSKHWSKTS